MKERSEMSVRNQDRLAREGKKEDEKKRPKGRGRGRYISAFGLEPCVAEDIVKLAFSTVPGHCLLEADMGPINRAPGSRVEHAMLTRPAHHGEWGGL
jgi:hypothetical protein